MKNKIEININYLEKLIQEQLNILNKDYLYNISELERLNKIETKLISWLK